MLNNHLLANAINADRLRHTPNRWNETRNVFRPRRRTNG